MSSQVSTNCILWLHDLFIRWGYRLQRKYHIFPSIIAEHVHRQISTEAGTAKSEVLHTWRRIEIYNKYKAALKWYEHVKWPLFLIFIIRWILFQCVWLNNPMPILTFYVFSYVSKWFLLDVYNINVSSMSAVGESGVKWSAPCGHPHCMCPWSNLESLSRPKFALPEPWPWSLTLKRHYRGISYSHYCNPQRINNAVLKWERHFYFWTV